MQHYQPTQQPTLAFSTALMQHPLLSRLIAEVKEEKKQAIYAKYDRTHNRHNRNL